MNHDFINDSPIVAKGKYIEGSNDYLMILKKTE